MTLILPRGTVRLSEANLLCFLSDFSEEEEERERDGRERERKSGREKERKRERERERERERRDVQNGFLAAERLWRDGRNGTRRKEAG